MQIIIRPDHFWWMQKHPLMTETVLLFVLVVVLPKPF